MDKPFHQAFSDIYGPRLNAFPDQQRREGFATMFFLAEKQNQRTKKPINIVETGSIRKFNNLEGDGASTLLFSHFLLKKRGEVYTVDLDPNSKFIVDDVLKFPNVKAVTMDSLEYLADFEETKNITILYLDSFDLDATNPRPSAEHHLKELKLVFDGLSPGTIIAVDDNFEVEGKKIGKGFLVKDFLLEKGVKLVYDGYQQVFQIDPNEEDLKELGEYSNNCVI